MTSTSTSATTGPVVEPAELRRRLPDPGAPDVIDVRTAAEFEAQHLPGSVHVPMSVLEQHPREVAARVPDGAVVVCQAGVLAERARQRLNAHGVSGATVLAGGLSAYTAAGGQVTRGRAVWAMERQVRFSAGSLVLLGLVGGRWLGSPVRVLSGLVGTGLVVSALTNTCTMARGLARLPWNRGHSEPSLAAVLTGLPGRD